MNGDPKALVESTFREDEMVFLKTHPKFVAAVEAVIDFDGYMQVCQLGEKLLEERDNAKFQLKLSRRSTDSRRQDLN